MTYTKTDTELISHLARRAGFGATREELAEYTDIGYEATVERFLTETSTEHIPDDLIFRRFQDIHAQQGATAAYWGYRLISTTNPLEEKITIFWHGVFATGNSKLNNIGSIINQISMFRNMGLGKFDDLLLEIAKDPAMIFWLDNDQNHHGSINENFGREILELFSMGVGNYTEEDIKECSRAFTGWTVHNSEYMALMAQSDSIWPYGRIFWHHEFRPDDHDNGNKTFLGETGPLGGEDVVQIISRQLATARFIARHLYNFFVSDEVPVPQWDLTPPKDPAAIEILANAYLENDHDIQAVLRILFNSEFFKESRWQRVKSPTDVVIGTLRKTGQWQTPDGGDIGIYNAMNESGFMGQLLLWPPSVEGWHSGEEWITTGSLVDRVNFTSSHLTNLKHPGVEKLVNEVLTLTNGTGGDTQTVNVCLQVLDQGFVYANTRQQLERIASENNGTGIASKECILKIFRAIVSSREYQLC